MYDASSRKDIRRAEKAAKLHEQNRVNYLIGAMSIPQGRQWFHDLLSRCHLFDGTRTYEPFKDYFMDGERNVGLQIFADLQTHCPDSYVKMMQEAHERSIERDILNERAAAGEQPGSADSGRDAEEFDSYPVIYTDGAQAE